MKKLLAFVLAVVLCSAMAITVLADTGAAQAFQFIYGQQFPGIPLSRTAKFVTAKCPLCEEDCPVIATVTGYKYLYCSRHGLIQFVETGDTPVVVDPAENHIITVRKSVGGTVKVNGAYAVDGTVTVAKKDACTLTVETEYGYECTGLYLNGYNLGIQEEVELGKLYRNYTVFATFKAVDLKTVHKVTAKTEGAGKVYATVNGKQSEVVETFGMTYGDKATLRFKPKSDDYRVANVSINGVDKGALSYYDISRLNGDLTVVVTYAWKNPFSDVSAAHEKAVEYVYEADIMASPNKFYGTDLFMGDSFVTVRSLAIYLAELCDVSDKLNTAAERIAWAEENGLVGEDEDIRKVACVERTCDMLNTFIRFLEKDRSVTFMNLIGLESSYDIAAKLGLVTEASYAKNGNLTRYGMADICYAIASEDIR